MNVVLKLVRFSLLLVAIPLGIIGILGTFIFLTLTNASLYTSTLDHADIYSELNDPEKYFNADDDNFQLFVGPLIDEFDVPFLAKTTIESNLDYLTTWVRGEDDLYLYFPVTEIQTRFQSDSFRNAVLNAFEVNYGKLPECTPAELEELEREGDVREEGNFLPPCKPPNFDEEFQMRRGELEAELDDILKSDDTFDEVLREADLEFVSEKTPFQTFIVESSDTPQDAQNALDSLNSAERILSLVRFAGPIIILFSFLFITIAGVTRKGSIKVVLNTIFNSYIIIGFILSSLAVALIVGRMYGINLIPFADISSDPIYDPIIFKAEDIIRTLTLKIVTSFSLVAFGVLLVSVIGRLGSGLLLKNNSLQSISDKPE